VPRSPSPRSSSAIRYLLALIVVAAGAVALHAAKTPPLHTFRALEHGLAIGADLYRYERYAFLRDA
jgi:hypothetical protein